MRDQNEELLRAWLHLSTTINNDRLTSELPYNEALLCNILYSNQQESPERILTATDLCRRSHMLKSQMNRTLQSMEEKGIILRHRSETDRRQVYITLNKTSDLYRRQHESILTLVNRIADKLGPEQVAAAIDLFTKISTTAEEILL